MMITGEVMREITDPDIRPISSYVFDMCIDNDILIIPRYDEKALLFFRLNCDK